MDSETEKLIRERERAEAECERLREALNNHHQWARTHGHEMGLGYLNSWLDIKTREALATPPPEGEPNLDEHPTDVASMTRREYLESQGKTIDAPQTPEQAHGDEKLDSDMQEVLDRNRRRNYLSGEAKQAHGDALAALKRVRSMIEECEVGDSEFGDTEENREVMARLNDIEYVIEPLVHQALTASGAPYVPEWLVESLRIIKRTEPEKGDRLPQSIASECLESIESMPKSSSGVPEEVRRLPENWRLASRTARRQMEPSVGQQISGVYSGCADELEAALASAPADGYKRVPVEPTEAMVRIGKGVNPPWSVRCATTVYRAMIAAAPTDGRE